MDAILKRKIIFVLKLQIIFEPNVLTGDQGVL